MRVLLIADLHANWPALLALQRAEVRPDAVLFAGDAVGYGPDPVECVRWLGAHAAAAVRGNHDQGVLDGTAGGLPAELAEAAHETLAEASRRLIPADRAALEAWPLQAEVSLGGASFHLVHGTPADPLAGELDIATCPEERLRSLLAGVPGDVLVLGHTHVPALRRVNGQLVVNPGSLGQPRYGVPDATYAIWDDGRVQIHHLHYDHDLTATRLRLMRLSPEANEVLTDVLLTGMLGGV